MDSQLRFWKNGLGTYKYIYTYFINIRLMVKIDALCSTF